MGCGHAELYGLFGGLEQCRVFQQREVRGEDGFFVGVFVFSGLGQGAGDFTAHLG
ncbi:hypothetical protein D3C76_1871260 [compost metagenome]